MESGNSGGKVISLQDLKTKVFLLYMLELNSPQEISFRMNLKEKIVLRILKNARNRITQFLTESENNNGASL